jgi:probable HAF family extracellular repeat protein
MAILVAPVAAVIISACAADQAPTGPSDQALVQVKTYTPTDLGTLGGRYSQAEGINARGQVVGFSATAAGHNHAFLWENGHMTDLGTLGGTESAAHGINAAGEIIGSSTNVGGGGRAFLWRNGVMHDLGSLGALRSPSTSIHEEKSWVPVQLQELDRTPFSGAEES